MAQPRWLGLSGAPNARDVGGMPGAGGRSVRTGRVFRSEALGRLTDDDLARLADTGLRAVVDLRGDSEVAQLGADRLPPGVTADQLSILDGSMDLYRLMAELIGDRDAGQQRDRLGDGGAERFMARLYRWFVADAGARARFATLLTRLADGARLPLLYHCTAGKDRTGWATAILLEILGVDRATIVADYLASNEGARVATAATLAGLRRGHLMAEPELLVPLLEVREDYLAAAYEQVVRDFGDVDGFLTRGLGLTASTRAALADALLV
jgi:protein-tyrosine phosphatase